MKIALVDDKSSDANRLYNFINNYPKKDDSFVVDIFPDGLRFLDNLKNGYDAIFLDIDMPIMNGLEVSVKIRELDKNIPIIFVTNYASLAINGYGVQALDFIVKPVNENDVYRVLDKVNEIIKKQKNDYKFVIKIAHGYKTVFASQIKYIEVDEHDIYFHCVDDTYTTHGTLKSIEASLENQHFCRCNYCYLVNLEYVDTIIDDDVIVDGEKIAISRNKKRQFIEKYLEVLH